LKLADLLVLLLLPIDPLTSLEQYKADWPSQYQSWRSGEASAKQMMQLLGMIDDDVGVE
jgi:hypothetical protein